MYQPVHHEEAQAVLNQCREHQAWEWSVHCEVARVISNRSQAPSDIKPSRGSLHWVVHRRSLPPLESLSGVFRGSSELSLAGQQPPDLLKPALLESLEVSAQHAKHTVLSFSLEAVPLESVEPAKCSL